MIKNNPLNHSSCRRCRQRLKVGRGRGLSDFWTPSVQDVWCVVNCGCKQYKRVCNHLTLAVNNSYTPVNYLIFIPLIQKLWLWTMTWVTCVSVHMRQRARRHECSRLGVRRKVSSLFICSSHTPFTLTHTHTNKFFSSLINPNFHYYRRKTILINLACPNLQIKGQFFTAEVADGFKKNWSQWPSI